MSLREPCHIGTDEPDDDGPNGPLVPGDKLSDALQSQIIDAFEAAIYQGMRPMEALAVIISWMSSEMTRIQAEHADRSTW